MYIAEKSALTLLAIFVCGIVAWGSFNWAMEATNTEAFCISCHEMENNVYREYKKSRHFSNSAGVRATCPDCHVPKEWLHKVVRKISASNELYHKFLGSIDTPEKFNEKRPVLAEAVWSSMRATDSRECRNCHSFGFMDRSSQSAAANIMHEISVKSNSTCIDCHQGIAHSLPDNFDREAALNTQHELLEKEKVDCVLCHMGMAAAPADDGWKID